ncbi:MAG: isoprenylcysteine carboxylmethyltransferase family protein [Limnochordales bacterium]|nr:isoprenylcysteine carboxylmethyltransferase family protein [Limnochordales bacterium]
MAMELRVPPPVVFLLSALLMNGLAAVVPALAVPLLGAVRGGLALVLFATGLFCGMLGLGALHRASTTPDPRHPERAAVLVTDGIYKYTRNPMYLGMATALLAWAVWLSNAAALAGVAAFLAYIQRFQIIPEERALAARFGAEYEAYRNSVPRWL